MKGDTISSEERAQTVKRLARLTGRPRGSANTRSARIHGKSAADNLPASISS